MGPDVVTRARTGGWLHFEHEADMGVRGTGSTLSRAFEQAALAMTAIITDPSTVVSRPAIMVKQSSLPARRFMLTRTINKKANNFFIFIFIPYDNIFLKRQT